MDIERHVDAPWKYHADGDYGILFDNRGCIVAILMNTCPRILAEIVGAVNQKNLKGKTK